MHTSKKELNRGEVWRFVAHTMFMQRIQEEYGRVFSGEGKDKR